MNTAKHLLSVNNLTVSAAGARPGTRQVLRDVDFAVERGEVLAIIGQSGSGKTTLARAIVKLLPPNLTQVHGCIALNGQSIDRLSPRGLRQMRRHQVNLIFQDPTAALNPTMTIGRQLFPPKTGSERATTGEEYRDALRLLENLGLEDPKACFAAYPFELSGGMKQRILIASTLLAKPSLIIADEPTSALDPVLRHNVLRMFLKMTRERGTAVVLITHDLPLVGVYADEILVLQEGSMVEEGNHDDRPGAHRSAPTRRLHLLHPENGAEGSAEDDIVLSVSGLSVDMPVRSNRFWKPRRHKRLIDDVNLEVRQGEIVGVLGASGAGKSTLGRCILGLIEPTCGTITIAGRMRSSPRQARAKHPGPAAVQVIYQNPYSSLSPKLTVRSIVLEPLRTAWGIDRTERESRFTQVMSDVGLDLQLAERLPHEMSGGQRQRVAIARALIGRPRLVVADEPVSSLDTLACNQVLELISRLRGQYGFACVFISHDLGALRSIADRITVMEEGRLVETDTVERIFDSPAHPCTARFVSAYSPMPAIPQGGA